MDYKAEKFNIDYFKKDDNTIKAAIEGILFISEEPVKVRDIAQAIGKPQGKIKEILEQLEKEYIDGNRGFIIKKVSGGYRFYSNPSISEILKKFVKSNVRAHLSQAALETLAITAYKQPVTRTQIAEIRGVRTDSVVVTLVDKGLLREAGKLKEPGNPILYKTTDKFLELLGLNKLDELPLLEDLEESEENKDF